MIAVASSEQRVESMAEKSHSFRDVTVWQKAHAFTLARREAGGGAATSLRICSTAGGVARAPLGSCHDANRPAARLLQGYINGMDPGAP